MRVMGIDPGINKTGIGVIEKVKGAVCPVFFETIKMKASDSRYAKLMYIFDNVRRVIGECAPDAIALEDIFYGKNFKAAIRLGEARSAAMLAATQCGITIHEYLPTRVKQAVSGNGRATKNQVQHMVMRILNVKEMPQEDAADALAIAICHMHAR